MLVYSVMMGFDFKKIQKIPMHRITDARVRNSLINEVKKNQAERGDGLGLFGLTTTTAFRKGGEGDLFVLWVLTNHRLEEIMWWH
jgi:hypothetical protein